MSQAGIASSSGGGGGAVTANLSPYIVGATKSDFTTIGAAITAASGAGASATNQFNIHVKPGTYVENITLTDGINLVGLCNQQNTVGFNYTFNDAVVVTGTITHTGECSITNIKFNSSTITTNGTLLKMVGCNLTTPSSSTFITVSATAASMIVIDRCRCDASTSSTTPFALSNNLTLLVYDSIVLCTTTSSTLGAHDVFLQAYRTNWGNLRFTTTVAHGIFVQFDDSTLTGFVATDNAASSINLYNCLSQAITLTGNGSTTLFMENCIGAVPTLTTVGSIVFANCISNDSSSYIKTKSSAFNGSEAHVATSTINTTDATVTTLASVTLNASETITLQGTITAAKSDHTDACGGNFNITVRRGAAGAPVTIGTALVNVNSSTTATFTVDNDGTSLVRIRVTGIAATTYNWVTNYTYQKVLTNA